MRVIRHGNGMASIVQEAGGVTKENNDGSLRHRRGGRSRILIQLTKDKPRVIRGSIFISGAEIERLLAKG